MPQLTSAEELRQVLQSAIDRRKRYRRQVLRRVNKQVATLRQVQEAVRVKGPAAISPRVLLILRSTPSESGFL